MQSCNWKINGYHVLIWFIRKLLLNQWWPLLPPPPPSTKLWYFFVDGEFLGKCLLCHSSCNVHGFFVWFGSHRTANARTDYFLSLGFCGCHEMNKWETSPRAEKLSLNKSRDFGELGTVTRLPKMCWTGSWLGSDKIENVNSHYPAACRRL